jgi:hypothetical protein
LVEGVEILGCRISSRLRLETETPVNSAMVWTDSENGFGTAALTKRRWSS